MRKRKPGLSRKTQNLKVYVKFLNVYTLASNFSEYCTSQAMEHVGTPLADGALKCGTALICGGVISWMKQASGARVVLRHPQLHLGQQHCTALGVECVGK